MLPVVILCGGKGTRAYPHTQEVPKPLLEVDGEPVLAHVMRIYARQGVRRFILAAGYKGDQIGEFASSLPEDWRVEIVDTGLHTNTGGRVVKLRDRLEGPFFLNYADGLADIDLVGLLDFHRQHGGAATLTTVPLPSQYGTIETSEGRVVNFEEKPDLPDHWINGGYFVFEEGAFEHWAGEDLERDVLPALAGAGELFAYRHDGFWKSMDTYKDALELSALAERGAPWEKDYAERSSS